MDEQKPSASLQKDFDVVVIGGGIVGLCTTWFLAREGISVVCLDAGVAGGSTANAGSLHVQLQSRLMRLFPERIPDYVRTLPIYPRAVDLWAEIAADLDDEFDFSIGGGLMVADDRVSFDGLREKVDSEKSQGIDSTLIDRRQLLDMAPYLDDSVYGAAYCRQEGKLNPLAALRAVHGQVIAHGAVVRKPERVVSIEENSSQLVVRCIDREYRCGRVVIAAGAGTGDLTGPLGCKVPVIAEPLHMNITEAAPAMVGNLLQHAQSPITLKQFRNGQIVIGGGWPAALREGSGAPAVTLSSMRGNLRLASRLVPSIANLQIIRTWAGINPTVDLLSVIGRLPTCSGVYVAVPGDAGFTLGPYCARLVVDEMQGRSTDFPLTDFSPGRQFV